MGECFSSSVVLENYDHLHLNFTLDLQSDDSTTCSHPTVLKQICTSCGQELEISYGASFSYLTPGLRLDKFEADRLGEIQTNMLLNKKKLVLVLDLDQTLIHSVAMHNLTPKEEYLRELLVNNNENESRNRGVFRMQPYFVKLRPFVDKFLEEASCLFEMYVYTLASRSYAMDVTAILDPEKKYFGSRIITREDCTRKSSKDLDVVLGHKRVVLIVDDSNNVWPYDKANLIWVQRFEYFAYPGMNGVRSKTESLAELKMEEENENKPVLDRYLQLLKKIHSQFFDQEPGLNLATRDVREVRKSAESALAAERSRLLLLQI